MLRNFKRTVSFYFALVLAVSCGHAGTKQTATTLKDTGYNKIKYPDTPDFRAHMAPLFAYWNTHKQLDVFDTGIDFTDQGFGPVDNYYNFIKAGHLFSDTQIHALMFYDIGLKDYIPVARVLLYKKNPAGTLWYKVLDDTIEDYEYRFRYKDWNSDGIRDFSYMQNGWEHGGHGPVTWYLWLVDKDGMPHRVKSFDELDDPQIDSVTRHIFSTIEGHTEEEMTEYIFSADSVKRISDDLIIDYDHLDIVAHYRNGKLIRKVKLTAGKTVYTPLQRADIGD